MGKTRVGVIFREGISGGKSSNTSADLENLSQKYQVFCKKIRSLREALQQQHASLQQLEATRTGVAKNFAAFSKNTPLWESTGQLPGGDRPVDSVCSYASVHDQLSAKTKNYAAKYKQFVIDYVVEWEKTVTTRIDAGLKKAEEHRRELDHYQKKVEALRLSTNKLLAQGKAVKPDVAEKLKRNEEKLITAKQTYNKVTSALCILMEEVTERSWRDLHPLLIKAVQFDMTISGDEAKILGTFTSVVDTLKNVGSANGISPQHRLKDLGSLNPELLSTRPGGASGLAIESGGSVGGGSVSPTGSVASGAGSSFDPMAMPPGSVGAQGMGGFPVAIASTSSANAAPPSRSSSFSTHDSGFGGPPNVTSSGSFEPPSTLSMLNISTSAAPPPTLEDVYSSGYNPSSTPTINTSGAGYRSAPVSGNLPPLPPSTTPLSEASPRSSSFSDYDRLGSGGALAGPPAAPPPPPPPADGGFGAPPAPPPAYGSSPYGASPYGASPYGAPPPPPAGGFGAPPPMSAYGASPYGAPPPPPASAAPPPPQYGQPPPTSHAPNMTNPFGY